MKEHRILKFFMPLLACVGGFALMYGCALVMGEDKTPVRFLAGIAAEIVLLALTLWFIRKPLTRLFPQVGAYPLCCPHWSVLAMLFLATPLWCILKGKLLYALQPAVEMQPIVYTGEELRADLMLCLSGVVVGPVFEEMYFRFLPLVSYKRRVAQVIVGLLVAVFFGLLHTTNMLGSFVDALIFMLVFVLTRQIGISIALHSFINLWAVLFCVLVYFGLLDIQHSSLPVIWLIGNSGTLIASVVAAAIGVAVGLCGRRIVGIRRD